MEAQGPGGDEGFTPDARGRLMQEVAAQMDAIEADHGENFQIGRVITVVEVLKPATEELDLRVRAQMLPWVAIGMLEFAKKSLGG
jgi:hypothetical protein